MRPLKGIKLLFLGRKNLYPMAVPMPAIAKTAIKIQSQRRDVGLGAGDWGISVGGEISVCGGSGESLAVLFNNVIICPILKDESTSGKK
jgi:hypothetical protein